MSKQAQILALRLVAAHHTERRISRLAHGHARDFRLARRDWLASLGRVSAAVRRATGSERKRGHALARQILWGGSA